MRKILYIIFLLLIYLKPYYGFLILPFFSFEYFFLYYYIFTFFYNKGKNTYKSIKIDKYSINSSSLDLWLQINKIKAFERFYKLLYSFNNKKKLYSLKNIFYVFFIIIFDIPLKLILFLKDILKIEGSLNRKLKIYYDILYDNNKDLKVEIIKNLYLLNCIPTVKGMLKILVLNYPHLSKSDLFDLVKTLQHLNKGYVTFEKSESKRVMTYMAQIETQEKEKIPFIHPTYYWHLKLNNFKYQNTGLLTLHGTSNCKIILTPTQRKGEAIDDFIKKGSANPGSIMTLDPKITKYSEFKSVSKIELEAVLYNTINKEKSEVVWDVEIENVDYLNNKKKKIIEHLNEFNPTGNIDNTINTLMVNNWNIPLNVDDNTILKEIGILDEE